MVDLKTTEESTRSPITGTEFVRLATVGANWKVTIANLASYVSSLIVYGVSSVAGKVGAVTLVQADVGGLTTTDFPAFKGISHSAERVVSQTFSQLPAAATYSGAIARITDSNTTRLGWPAAGGGANLISVQSDGTVWRVMGSPFGRRVACGNILFYISITGNDTTGDGQQSSPFRTLNRAWEELVGTGTGAGIDTNGFRTTFALEDGIHDYSASLTAIQLEQGWEGGGELWIQGNASDPSAVTIQGSGGSGEAIAISANGPFTGKLVVQNLKFTGWHVNVWGGWYSSGVIWAINIIHGNGLACNHVECASPNTHMIVFGTDTMTGGGSSNSHLFARQGGRIHYFATPCDIGATQTLVAGFCRAQDKASAIDFEPPVFTGSQYIGPRWDLSGGAALAIWGNNNWTEPDPTTAINGDESSPDLVDGDASLQWARNNSLYQRMSGMKAAQELRLMGNYGAPFFHTTLTPYRETSFVDVVDTYSLALPQAQGLPGSHLENDGTGQFTWVDGRALATGNLNFYVSRFTGTTAAGSGYTNGSYDQVAFTGGTGTGATANIVVEGNAVTLVKPRAQGTGYIVGDVLSCASIGAGSGFTFTITVIGDDSAENEGQSISTPFATLTRALEEANKYNYQELYSPSIFPENGFYDEGNNISFPPSGGDGMNCLGLPSVRGRSARPESIEFYTLSDVFLFASGGSWTCWGMRLSSSNSGAGFAIGNGSYFEFYDMEYNAIDHAIVCNTEGFAYGERNTIVGTGGHHGFYRGIGNGIGQFFDTITIQDAFTLPGINAFVRLQSESSVVFGGTFVGGVNVTGRQYHLDPASSYTGPALATIPGTTGGVISAGARVNGAFAEPVFLPDTSGAPTADGELLIEATNNTTLTFKYKGSDSTVRSGTLTLV